MAPDIPLSSADALSSRTAQPRLKIHGEARVRFEHRAGATRLAALFHHDPLRVLFPNPRVGDLPVATLVTTSGGLVGGDRLDVSVEVGPGASALVTTQAAEKIYRSTGADVHVSTGVTVGPEGWLEWLPQEAILFDGARLRRATTVHLEASSRLMAGELLVFGRIASGERFTRGLARDAWEVRRDGRLAWADALHLDGDVRNALDHPACFGGAAAYGTILYAAPDAARHLDAARRLIDTVVSGVPPGVLAAATCLDGMLVIRWLGDRAHHVRRAYAGFWAGFRAHAAGLPGRLPRLWDV
ncbi:urease accessory protein UreD [Skermanella sp. TT6]|uniref:Urease accessory protein UreD n=1 Tax=Skermanella cutis TaxID=2775420 RepID=A0ABX7B599_9PROT|nr:urease accessory protein UreD [Skermanella sp. TT6]QQP87706.1 urease accessory protein UreD [Skermanella sp. TT6]